MDGLTYTWKVASISTSRALREAGGGWCSVQWHADFYTFTMGSRYLPGQSVWFFRNGLAVANWRTFGLDSSSVSDTRTSNDELPGAYGLSFSGPRCHTRSPRRIPYLRDVSPIRNL